MKIIVDTREQNPYGFDSARYDCLVDKKKLDTGDYSVEGCEGLVGIERKELGDIVSCLCSGRDRFERELQRSKSFEFFAVVIEADFEDIKNGNYHSQMKPHAVFQSLFAFQVRYGVHIIWASSRSGGEYATYSLLQKFAREKENAAEKAA